MYPPSTGKAAPVTKPVSSLANAAGRNGWANVAYSQQPRGETPCTSYWRRRIPRDFLVRAGVCHVPLLSNVLLRRPLAILAVLYGVCAFAAGQQKDAPVAAPEFAPAWSRSYPTLKEQRVSLALSDGARCTAIAGGGEVEVLDAAGHSLWKWNYRATNRFIVAGPVAVSPGCDAIALAGDSGYKKVWLADLSGRAMPLTISSTPLGVAFDRRGELLAVGTGGGSILLFGKTGKLLWKRTFVPPCYLPEQMSFSSDNRYLLIRAGGSGVLRTDGSVVFGGASWWNDWRLDDRHERVARPAHLRHLGGVSPLARHRASKDAGRIGEATLA